MRVLILLLLLLSCVYLPQFLGAFAKFQKNDS